MVTVKVPKDPANVESPEYLAVMTCEPEVEDEKVYVAEPFDSDKEDVSVEPSTVIVSVPLGDAAMALDCGATVIVMTSLAPAEGVPLEADSVVIVPSSEEDEAPPVHDVKRL
jgi:hypothetical protein